jgi:Domain of unknown function (DUF892)
MKLNSLRDLYITELKDLYDAENRIIKALPKMAGEKCKGIAVAPPDAPGRGRGRQKTQRFGGILHQRKCEVRPIEIDD